jgi:hypothetical protein
MFIFYHLRDIEYALKENTSSLSLSLAALIDRALGVGVNLSSNIDVM